MRSSSPNKLSLVLLVIGAGVLFSGCAIGFRAPATDITTTSVTLNGGVGSNRSEQGEWWFRYGKTTAYGNETPHRSIEFTALTGYDVSEPVSGLESGTTYHYGACADDQEPGVDAFCSGDQTFTTRPTGDFVSGAGNVIGVDFTLTVHGGPSGENPTGFLTTRSEISPNFNFDATPTCLNVSGSSATTGYRIDTGSQAGSGFMAAFTDNGSSGDQALWYIFSPDPPTDCPLPTAPPIGSTTGPATISGDIEVVDAPSPTQSTR
jgi:hypothetical protein